jgi:hypothetical protein
MLDRDLLMRAPVFQRLAKASRMKDAHKNPLIDVMIRRLRGNPADPRNKIARIAEDMGFYRNAAQAEHFQRDWLNDPPGHGFWKKIDTEAIMRVGLVAVLKTFKRHGLPLEFFWVIDGPRGTRRWEMSISVCATVIVVMFHTPQFRCPVWTTRRSTTMSVVRAAGRRVGVHPVLVPTLGAGGRAQRATTKRPARNW